ncbi:hypothetical protein Bca52824_027426 [Brassica carinata]|uniref:TIR domain-containing protein n=1 Tax=Brassica carinata TaxID=52824 RepID=A0A8X7SJT0_BRACI|nr:hypothetical protein Bca52824_027426 [Brassica carinata]
MSSSTSFVLAGREVDVFLSFCGGYRHEDLRVELHGNGIQTFVSSRCFQTSVLPVNRETRKALEVSKFAVVMTSKTKPCSAGFLEELIAILEFQEKGSLTVIPIFLAAFSFDLEERICQEYPEKAPSWRAALTKLANIATNYPFPQNLLGMCQLDQIRKIAHDIYLLVLTSTSKDLNALVAMDRHMKVVNDLLASEPNKEVHTIGIWGRAGVGKTTLARYVYANISVDFQTQIFLENVENMEDKILKFEGGEDPTLITSLDHVWHEVTEAKRKHRKGNGSLIEYAKWFALGSKVILISQNKNLLVEAGVRDMYEVRTLRYDEALQLFSHFAFKQPYPPSDFEQLSVRAVHLSEFLPLALRLLGSFLNGRGRGEWVAALLKLKAKQGGNIMEVWKLMAPSGESGHEELEAATEIMEERESSLQDTGKEEKEVAADIIAGSSQDKT